MHKKRGERCVLCTASWQHVVSRRNPTLCQAALASAPLASHSQACDSCLPVHVC